MNAPVWHGEEFITRLRALIVTRLDKAARHLVNKVKQKLSLTGVGQAIVAHTRVVLWGRWKDPLIFLGKHAKSYAAIMTAAAKPFSITHYKKRQRIYGFVRSLPGEPPRKQTGELRMSITHEVDADTLTARVGSQLKRAKFLELGTRKMQARPFLRITAFEESAAIAKIMGGEMNFNNTDNEA